MKKGALFVSLSPNNNKCSQALSGKCGSAIVSWKKAPARFSAEEASQIKVKGALSESGGIDMAWRKEEGAISIAPLLSPFSSLSLEMDVSPFLLSFPSLFFLAKCLSSS